MVQNEAVSHNTFNLMFSILISFLYVTVGCKEDPDVEAVEVGNNLFCQIIYFEWRWIEGRGPKGAESEAGCGGCEEALLETKNKNTLVKGLSRETRDNWHE